MGGRRIPPPAISKTMSLQSSLDKYTKARGAIRSHIEAKSVIFKTHEDLVGKQIDAENELRDDVFLEKQGIQNDTIKVLYSPVFKKYYDGGIFMQKADAKMKQALLDKKGLTYEIDKEIFEALVGEGIIPIQLKQEVYKEQEKNPRVSIRDISIKE